MLLGKLALHEFADGEAVNEPFPAARNPWNLDYSPGGSSSGSAAALSAGLCFGSVGSDTGFSARGPAAWCNLVSLKPTYGLVSRAGALPLSWSTDHMSPMARNVEDCALMLDAVAGYDPRDPTSAQTAVTDVTGNLDSRVAGLRLGVPRGWFAVGRGLDPEIEAAMEAALEVFRGLGCRIVDVDSAPFVAARDVHSVIRAAEAYAYHEQTLSIRPHMLGESLRRRIDDGGFARATGYLQAQNQGAALTAEITRIISEVDALVLPTSARSVPAVSELDSEDLYAPPSLTNAFNLSGHPAISVPCGFDSHGLPMGLQVVGPLFKEPLVLQVAYSYQQATPWKDLHPEL